MQGNTTLRITIVAALALLAAATIFGGLRPQVVSAAAFTVTKTADTNDGTCDGDCSLREAVVAANATVGVHDNISIPAGTYVLTGAAGEDASASGDLDVTDSVSFNGAGMTTTIIDGGDIEQVIDVLDSAETLILTDLTVTNGLDEGVFSEEANIALSNVAVIGNDNEGVTTLGGNVSIQSSVIDGNGDEGIDTGDGNVTVTRSTVSFNDGGGIEAGNGNITTTNSTVSENGNDGVNALDGEIVLNWSTVADNDGYGVSLTESGAISLYGTIVADNADDDCSEKVEDSSFSLDSDGSCDLLGTGDVSDGFADLGPLQNNGGTTETHALQSESDAIDAGGTGCPEDDQRGEERFNGNGCDIGAYESGGEQNTPGPTSTPGSATATGTPGRAKTHTPTATGTPEATDTPAPATSTKTPAPAQPGGDRAGVVRGPDTGSGPGGGSSQVSLLFGAAMLAVAGAGALAMGRKIRR